MTKKCGNCKYWRSVFGGARGLCEYPVPLFVHNAASPVRYMEDDAKLCSTYRLDLLCILNDVEDKEGFVVATEVDDET